MTPARKKALYVQSGRFLQDEPDVQYRGIFINDERFGGWARWVEQTFDKEPGKVGPKVYEKVFELLLRLRGYYLWPAMHNGSQAFDADPENARLADDYAIVMGTSHCEQMLRNNEDEWKNAGEGEIRTVKVLGFSDGVTVLPFDTPSYTTEDSPAIEYVIDVPENAEELEVRTLANLHVYEGRDIRYAVSVGDRAPEVFSIHTGDFSAEWRLNVLRGYSSRSVDISSLGAGKHKVRVYLLDPGLVLQELNVR